MLMMHNGQQENITKWALFITFRCYMNHVAMPPGHLANKSLLSFNPYIKQCTYLLK